MKKPSPARLTPETVQPALEEISLKSALIDVEVANARAIDMARRLTAMSEEILNLRSQLYGRQGEASTSGSHHRAPDAGEETFDDLAAQEAARLSR
ncbi:hypothetical protein [Brevundimonas sp.]|uniref:hypothetical protein n=1 Tax=Brevundimonas sp. TaxID=1871086 RepID=UPI001A1D37E3|nr:hypothetical protein [Brevundimonas sp.]MBJ7483581.1 hypothetical protein [Brevundimonas sp.]